MEKAKPSAILFLFWFMMMNVTGQVFEYADSAYQVATVENKALLIIFTGSDWCPHCQRLDKNILKTQEFSNYTKKNLVVLQADFPQRKKLDNRLIEQNDELAEQYNPNGLFPTLVLMNADRTIHQFIEYKNQSTTELTQEFDLIIKSFLSSE